MKQEKNDWWNMAVGSSMMVSAIGSAINVGLNAANTFYSLATGGSKNTSSYNSSMSGINSFYSPFIGMDQMYTRISKYPSKTTVSYASI